MSGDALWTPSFSGDEPIVSHGQNAEDVRLWRVFRNVENGFYVDIGAADPNVDSVTRLFYEHGWSGINVEPSPCFEAISKHRPRDVNLHLAIGESEGDVPFYLTYPYLGMSTGDLSVHSNLMDAIDRIEETTVPQRRLESVLQDHAANRPIHFLKVDVEGAERQVLASSDWISFRPIVVVVEAIESWSTTPTHRKWEDPLLDAGYRFATFDGINRFYVEPGHDHLISALAYPISALDRFVTAAAHDMEARLRRVEAELAEARQPLDASRRQTWRTAARERLRRPRSQ